MIRSIGAALLLVSCGGRTVSGTAMEPDGGDGQLAANGGTPQAPVGATLLDEDALVISAVSPDEQHVLVAHRYPPTDVELVTPGAPTKTLVSNAPIALASFSPDGRSIAFTQSNLAAPYAL